MTKTFSGHESVKCIAGGAETVEDVAASFEAYAVYLREMVKDGVKFDLSDICSGHMELSTDDPKIGAKYGFDSIEDDGKGHFVIRDSTGEVIDEYDEEAT